MSVSTKSKILQKGTETAGPSEGQESLRTVCYGLRLLREARGLTQDEIGQRANVPPASVSRYERALVLPNLETLHRILRALGVGFGELARAGEEVQAAREQEREPEPLLLEAPGDVDEDRVLAFFMAQVQRGRGLEYVEQLEHWAARLRTFHETLEEYSRRAEDEPAEEPSEP